MAAIEQSNATVQRGDKLAVSTIVNGADSSRALAYTVLAVAAVVVVYSIALTIRTYMVCPLLDQWTVLADIADGKKVWDWHWLWSQNNEHRIVIPRLLIWLDWVAFGGKSISLLVETYLLQIAQCAIICYAIERSVHFPRFLKRTLEGLFTFCLFHPNQAQNLISPFQISFITPFAVGTVAFLAVAFFDRLRHQWLAALYIAFAPLIAALALSGGLLIGPVALALGQVKRLPRRFLLVILGVFSASAFCYFFGYQTPGTHSLPLDSFRHPIELVYYVLSYLDASFLILPHRPPLTALISMVFVTFFVIRASRHRDKTTNFEWFCLAQCTFVVAIACVTGLGRLRFGTDQAFSSRYQTPAMLYWCSLLSLVVVQIWRTRPRHLNSQAWLLAPIFTLTVIIPFMWGPHAAHADNLRRACVVVLTNPGDTPAAEELCYHCSRGRELVKRGAELMRDRWASAAGVDSENGH